MHSLTRPALGLGLAALALTGCTRSERSAPEHLSRVAPPVGTQLFTRLPSDYTGVRFENRLHETRDFNIFTYRNYYNGGGVALGDLNGDGLPEIFLTANQGPNRLYLNEGGFHFRDVTDEAGVAGDGPWSTGVVFADVNGDGRLDIYVCYAGTGSPQSRANELFINQGPDGSGVPRFREMAAAYGVADEGASTQAAFFDYDRDGRLDLYVVNNSSRPASSFGVRNDRGVRSDIGGDRLYHNEGDHFVDVSAKAGIYGAESGFGLGIGISDVNRDGWPDVYVSNDFFERDFLYLNQHDGTFREVLDREMPYLSAFSMGLDVADVNNDGWPDIYTTDMLPEDDRRLKTVAAYESWQVYQEKLKNGYHRQFMRNMLQMNNGDGTFSDVGQMEGVAATDWSWAPLLADFDLDGYKDLFVTNGMARDVTSQDYIAFLGDRRTMLAAARGHVDFLKLVHDMASTPLPNYAFRNQRGTGFEKVSAAWGLDAEGFSSGAAYGDLDGDGAPDLVVNDVNGEALVYRNNARVLSHNHYLQVRLEGAGANPFAVGARVTVRGGGQQFVQEMAPARGFQSSVDYTLDFGVGSLDTLESVAVDWPDGRSSVLSRVKADQRLTIREADSERPVSLPAKPEPPAPLFSDVTDRVRLGFVHHEDDFVDFDRERLMPKMVSREGPFTAVGDVNGDGLDDLFIGGAKHQPGALLVQQQDGSFVRTNEALFAADETSEDLGAVFFDADGDHHPDLYVVSGGNEFSSMAPALQDRLYLNDGRGNFHKAEDALPAENVSGSRVAAADFDGDGDVDLFVGGRVVPWHYGLDPQSMLLENDGRGHFRDVTARAAPELARVGMVTDALWRDVDGDGRVDLVVVGEWMPITVFHNSGHGHLKRVDVPGLEKSNGWWNRIVAGDFTGDGRVDFIVGNLGLNTPLHASVDEPTTMYVKDFNGDGLVEQVLVRYEGGAAYPLALRDELLAAIPSLKPRFPNHRDYAGKRLDQVFSASDLDGAVVKEAFTFSTALARNNGDGSFTLVPLPREAQLAPIYGISAGDFDGDGHADLLLAGNFDAARPQLGRLGSSYGLLLRGDGRGHFTPVRAPESGFVVPGETRDIARVRTRTGDLYVVARNDDRPLLFRAAPAGRVASRPSRRGREHS
ncbi:MAG TPA: VCBS repeat-containing protein [Longimicrobiaceae bacterium]|nr:VCBS repeat-containing protein [Longimicrobiaceae bacterium]